MVVTMWTSSFGSKKAIDTTHKRERKSFRIAMPFGNRKNFMQFGKKVPAFGRT